MHKCTICNSSFFQKDVLNGHIARIHEKKKPHKCGICPAAFFNSGHLFYAFAISYIEAMYMYIEIEAIVFDWRFCILKTE